MDLNFYVDVREFELALSSPKGQGCGWFRIDYWVVRASGIIGEG